MNNTLGIIAYLVVGFIGGFIGFRLKITGCTLVGAMFAVILLNFLIGRNFKIPANYTFITQVLIGVMVGASFSKEVGRTILPILLPVLFSTLVLVTDLMNLQRIRGFPWDTGRMAHVHSRIDYGDLAASLPSSGTTGGIGNNRLDGARHALGQLDVIHVNPDAAIQFALDLTPVTFLLQNLHFGP